MLVFCGMVGFDTNLIEGIPRHESFWKCLRSTNFSGLIENFNPVFGHMNCLRTLKNDLLNVSLTCYGACLFGFQDLWFASFHVFDSKKTRIAQLKHVLIGESLVTNLRGTWVSKETETKFKKLKLRSKNWKLKER